ncbi:large exoprotein involved in heme utilizationor adhesion [Actinobacillus pleuropneumoniae]|uniref:two-partner secretion domain-containing protein n=1 Tax=Actinobacillus pleuropneumoniae TaxID=715 RepID=UPI001A9954E8|nr:hemagglutinin repeat-containing protein [Actinobacillus pleuropneumoniae]QSZ39924.1 large exoprotein involved in heme utilizationor adhesion [Actinobacillus pleuropneumoniae]
MNKKCFRVIFSKTLQRLVVTSELAKSEGKSTEQSAFSLSQIFAQIRPLTFSLYCALGFVAFSDSALANLIIQADKSAPKNQQPIVLQTANGLPQVNIQTPNDKGLSHNKYSKFDVDTKGAILNNSRTNVQTQQGGLITGNPYLAKGEAKVILNEVNSSDPSVLKGYVEVAGKKADVIIANPSGLHCEGCGIINSDRATLTTGKPQIKNGHLDSFVVEKGKVKVSGKGLDNSRVDYTEIIARETEVNAGIWSKKEAKVVTGKNTIKRSESPENLQIIHTNQPLATESQPQFAIDVGELGGMYSGKIHLIGTEHGVGVRNAGHIGASAETLKIDSEGRIVNTGTLNANHAVQLVGTKGIENRGKIENRQGDITFNTAADIQQDGSVVARSGNIHQTAHQAITQQGETVAKGRITYKAPKVTASTSSLIAAGVEIQDTPNGETRTLEKASAQGQSIVVNTTGKSTLQGKVLASNVQVNAAEANLDNSQIYAYALNVQAKAGNIQADNAVLMAEKTLNLTTPAQLQTQNSVLKAETLTTQQRSLNTKGAIWEQTGSGELKLNVADKLQNRGGTFKTQGDLTVNAQGMDNQQGRLLAKGKLTVNAAQGKVDTTQGMLVAEKDVVIKSGEWLNDGGLIQSHQNVTINTHGQALSNQQTLTATQDKGIVALGQLNIQSSNFSNQQGRVVSGGNQQLTATNVNNDQGLVYTQQNLALNAQNLTNHHGMLNATQQATLALTGNLSQTAGTVEAERITLSAQNLNSREHSRIVANQTDLTMANQLDNSNSLIQAKTAALTISSQALNNTKGDIQSLQGRADINTHQQTLDNTAGKIRSKSTLTLNSGKLDNTQGAIHSESDIWLDTHHQTLTNQNTLSSEQGIVALGKLTLKSADLVNQQGYIASREAQTLNARAVDNTQGLIKANQALTFVAQSVENKEGIISGKTVANISVADHFTQTAGQLGADTLLLNAARLTSDEGSLISATKADIQVSGQFSHQQSRLNTVGDLTVQSQGLNNLLGVINSAGGNIAIQTPKQQLNNTRGQITAKGKLMVNSGELQNQAGLLYSEQDIKINTHGNTLNNQQIQGKYQGILALGNVTIDSGKLDNTQGVISAKSVQLNSTALTNRLGRLQSNEDLSLTTQHLENSQGIISGAKKVTLTVAKSLQQTAGQIGAGELTLNAGSLQSTEKSVIAADNATLTVQQALTNTDSEISATHHLAITSQALDNQRGLLLAEQGNLTLNTQQQQINNQHGKVVANQQLQVESGALNNQNGLVQGKTGVSLNTHQQSLDNTLGKIISQQALTIAAGELNNQQGHIQSTQQADIHLGRATLHNTLGVMKSEADLRLNAGVVRNHQSVVDAKNLQADLIALEQEGGVIQANQSLNLTASGQISSTNRSLIQGENLHITVAGQLDNQQSEIIAKQNATLSSGQLNNNQAAIVAEQGNLQITTHQQALTNQQGKLSAGANLTLESGDLDNTAGLIQSRQNMTIHTHQGNLNNQQTQVSAQNSAQNKGIIALGELALTTQNFLNQQGYLLSQQAQTLNARNLENDSGVLASLGGQKVSVRENITNRQGRISGESTTLTAQAIDNQAGLLQGSQALTVQVQGNLNNAKGQVKSKETLNIKANEVNNREGQVRATEGTLSLSAVFTLDNTLGNITAKQQATIEANALNNQQGLVYNEQGLLHINVKQALDNANGSVISKDTFVIKSDSFNNQQGTLYAENQGNIHVNGLLDNRQLGKIHGLGEMAIQANQIDNRGGEIRTQHKLVLNATADINNQKVSHTGSFIESGNVLSIHTAQLNNRQTQSTNEKMSQGILASALTISAQVLDNQQGKIHSRVQGDLQIQSNLNNQQGEITGGGNVAIQGKALTLNNQNGRLQAVDSLSLFADEVTTNGHIEGRDITIRQQKDFVTNNHINADRSLSISTAGNLTNQHNLYADEQVTLNANHITNRIDGRISSANTHITAKGDLTNEGLINSVSADENAQTVIKVGGRLTNTGKGRIYGDNIALQADKFENRDKDYGNGEILSAVVAARGRLDIGAREIENNTGYYLSDNQVGATLFSVGDMSFGRILNGHHQAEGKAEVLRNNSSVIESESRIRFGVDKVYNNNTHFTAAHVKKDEKVTEITKVSENPLNETYIIPMHRDSRGNLPTYYKNDKGDDFSKISSEYKHIPMELLRWAGWSRAGQLVYNLNNVEPTVLSAGETIRPDMLLASRNQMRCDSYSDGAKNCTYIPAGNYGLDSPIWTYAGVPAPSRPSPIFSFDELASQGYKEEDWFSLDPKTNELDIFNVPEEPGTAPEKPIRLENESEADFQLRMDSYQQALATYTKAEKKWDYYQNRIKPYNDWVAENEAILDAVDKKIEEHNQNLSKALGQQYFRDFWQITLKNRREDESKVLTTVAGQIIAGGNLEANSQSFVNNRSVVIAGQDMLLENKIKNEDEKGLHRITDTGDKVFTFDKWRGGRRRYFQRKWENGGDYTRIIETPFDMQVVRTEKYVNYADNKQTDDSLKNKTLHQLSLSNVSVQNDVLSAQGNKTLGGLNSLGSASFTSLGGTVHRVDALDAWSGNGTAVDVQTPAGKQDAFQTLRGNAFKPTTVVNNNANTPARPLVRIALNEQQEVRSIQPNLVIPQNVLYRVNANPTNRVLVETDPDFTNQKRWLSSDYMFNALRYEPNAVQKRLGDGFYEQRLVREQINRLTGRNFVGNYTDFDSQYRGLMDAGITFAQKFNLRPGIALSSDQVAQLTADIVWLESEQVTLPNGKVENVLVPKVYALAKKGDITGNGTLLSGNKVIHKGGEFINSGTVAGRELVQFDSESIRNSGNISGGAIVGKVSGDMENLGGTLEADRAILLNVAGNFNHTSQTHTTSVNEQGYQRTDTTIGRKGLLHVKGEDGTLQIQAHNINLAGADIINDGQGQTYLSAKNNLNLTALSVGFDEKMGGGNHYRNEAVQSVEVSRVQGKGDVVLSGQNIYSEAAQLEAKQRLALLAENDVVLGSATTSSALTEYHHTKSGGAFGSSKKTTLDTYQDKTQVGTTLGGGDILVSAGNDLKAKNLQAIADKDLSLQAVNNVSISADTNYFKDTHFEQKSKSGMFSGGIGITFGKKSETHESEAEGWQQSQARSTLGSVSGNVSVKAGNHAHLSGTDLIASKELGKAITIEGKSTYIGASQDELSSKERHEYKQSGLTIAFSSAVTDAAMAVQSSLKRSEQVKDERLSQLLKVKAANEAVETVQKASKAIDAIQKAGSVSEGLANSDAKISVSIGASKSVSTSHTQQTTHQGSELSAGAVTVRATEGDNSIVGSKINAKEATIEGSNINLLGTTDTQSNRSDNKNSSWSVGVFVGKSGGSTGLGIEGAASVGKGHSNSDSQVQNHTEINADRLTIKAKETTTLKGATANINHLALDTKNLHIESVQDIEKYDSKQTQGGVSASVAIYGSGSSVSAQGSRTKANVDYAQVNQQSGFNIKESSTINVEENTHLKGGIINAQGDKANHSLKTGTLTTENIENRSDIKVSSVSAGVSSDMTQMATMAVGAALSALGNTNESERSQTQAAISSNINVQITDSEKQKSLTGKTAEETLQGLNRDVANANQKLDKQDLTKAQERQEMVQTIGQISEDWLQFAVGDKLEEAAKKRQEADAIEKENPTKATVLRAQAQAIEAEYGLGSNLQMGVRAATAALQGLATGSVNQAAVGAVSPYLNKLIKAQTGDNKEANLIAHAVLGAVEAHITGNNAAAGALGALTAEAAAPLIMQTLYGTEKPENLTDSQKQNVSNLSQIAAGLSGGLVGDSTVSGIAGAEIGKRAVENNALSLKDVYQYQKALKAAIQNGESVEEVHQRFKELSEKQRAELVANCDIECRATVPNELLGAVGFADELSGAFNNWLSGLPADEQTKFYQLVEEENAKTIEVLKAQQSGLEKGAELALGAVHLLAKEDINNSSNKRAIYNPKQTRAKIEDKFGEHNVKSTTVVQNTRSTVTERTLKTGESVQIIQSEGGKAIQVHSKPDEFGNTKLLANIAYDTRGLPVFDDVATFTTKIEKPKNYQNLSSKVRRELEMKNATLALKQEIEQGKVNKNLFTQRQLEDIYSGKAQIDKYTWHHNAQSSPNNMQLLPTNIHDAVKHIGEASLSEGR